MRILYGIHGYGRGHATRALALLPHLLQKHRLLIFAGGDAYEAISPEYPVIRIPTLGFAYTPGNGRRSSYHTMRRNVSGVLDFVLHGPVFEMVRDLARDFAPDVVISDAEVWTHRVAASLKIPRISIDHIGILAYCRPPIDWNDRFESHLDTLVYKTMMGCPDRIIVSSFYPAPPRRKGVIVVGPLPRPELHRLQPTTGEHILVYFNRGQEQLTQEMLNALAELPCNVHIYGTARRGQIGRLTFLPTSNLPFLEDMASCRAVLSTAGNQLMGEAMYLGKPVLVVPERCVEQRLNAAAVERLGIGVRLTAQQFTAARLCDFLGNLDRFTVNIRRHARDSQGEATAALDLFLAQLAPAASAASTSNLDNERVAFEAAQTFRVTSGVS